MVPGSRLTAEWNHPWGMSRATVPAGSGGVLFTPWLNGERSPVDDRTLRAAFLNVSMTTERAHLVRAVLEGVAFNARWLLDVVERFIKRPMPVLRILGGGAMSDLWCQIHADVLDRRIEPVVHVARAKTQRNCLPRPLETAEHVVGVASRRIVEPEVDARLRDGRRSR